MNAKKRQTDEVELLSANPPRRGLSGKHRAAMAVVIVVLAAGSCYLAWQEVSGRVLAEAQYVLESEQIDVTPPPPQWIHSDIRSDVVRQAGMDGPLSLVDPQLTVRMADAFASHPWVARVERVSKHYPASLLVVVSYRQPVAMVEVDGGVGGLPVDAQGVLLPTRDFSAEDAQRYPRIGEIHAKPAGPVGSAWGDPRVVGAAQVAAVLLDDWKKLGLFRIVPGEKRPGRRGAEYTYLLVTHSGTTINWGRSPATHVPGEVPAAEKIAQLKRYAAQNHGSLDDPEGQPHEIIITDSGALVSNTPPPVDPLPKSFDE
jgi:hypothetical protein